MLLHGALFGIICLTSFYAVKWATGDLAAARTAAFLSLSISQTLHAYNLRSHKPIFTIGVFSNKLLNIATVTSLALIFAVAFIPPVAGAFSMTLLPAWAVMLCLGLALLPLVIDETVKLVMHFRGKRTTSLAKA